MIAGSQHAELKAARDTMLYVLTEATRHRGARPDVEVRDGESQLAWVFYEREQMAHAVNLARQARGLPDASPSEIRRVERQAEGHSDYASKYALYCAELAMGIDPPGAFFHPSTPTQS